MGSPQYMAPEQMLAAKNADARSDIWALGAVLFEVLVGEPPVAAETFAELVIQVTSLDPAKLAVRLQNLPPDLAQAPLRCLNVDPSWPLSIRRRARGGAGAFWSGWKGAASRRPCFAHRPRLAASLERALRTSKGRQPGTRGAAGEEPDAGRPHEHGCPGSRESPEATWHSWQRAVLCRSRSLRHGGGSLVPERRKLGMTLGATPAFRMPRPVHKKDRLGQGACRSTTWRAPEPRPTWHSPFLVPPLNTRPSRRLSTMHPNVPKARMPSGAKSKKGKTLTKAAPTRDADRPASDAHRPSTTPTDADKHELGGRL